MAKAATAKSVVGRAKPTLFFPKRKRGEGSRRTLAGPAPKDSHLANWDLAPEELIHGPKEAKRPAITRSIGRVQLVQPKPKVKHDPGTVFSPADVELANAVLADGGEEAYRYLLNEVPTKGEDMPITSEDLRKAVMDEFATPQFPSDASRSVAAKKNVAFGDAYSVFHQLAKSNLLVQAGRVQHPGTGRMLFQYVFSAAQLESPTAAVLTPPAMPVLVSRSTGHDTKPKVTKTLAEHQAGGRQLLDNGRAHFVGICSDAAHFLVDVSLGIRELSDKDVIAMRHLLKMLRQKVDDDESAA